MTKKRSVFFLAVLLLFAAVLDGPVLTFAKTGTAERYRKVSSPEMAEKNAASFTSTSKAGITMPRLTSVKNVTGGVKLTWSKSSGAAGYRVYRAGRQDDRFSTIKTITNVNTLTYTDQKVTSGTEYCYSIIAYDRYGNTSDHDTYGVYIHYLSRPTVSSLSSSSKGVLIKWSKTSAASGYIIYRKLYGASSYTKLKTVGGASNVSYTDTSAVSGKKYTYTVRAYKKNSYITSYSAVNSTGKTITYSKSSSSSGSGSVVYRALLIGESAYEPDYFDMEYSFFDESDNLYGPYNDVRAMRRMLRGMNYSAVTMKENIGRSAILRAIQTAFANADSNDVSLFYYSGHGDSDYGTYSGALSLPGTSQSDSIMKLNDLAAALKKVPGRVVVLLDSCGSGAAVSSVTGQVGAAEGESPAEEQIYDFDPDTFNESVISAFASADDGNSMMSSKYRDLVVKNKFYVITASKVYENSQDLYLDYVWGSAFSRGIVTGGGYSYYNSSYSGSMPADTNKNKSVTLEEMYAYARTYAARAVDYVSDGEAAQHVLRYPSNSTLVVYKK